MPVKLNTWLTRLFFALCIAIYTGHLWIILRNAVNVPYWDEWGILAPTALPAGFTFSWIVTQANEHRIVPTKLLAWALFYIDGHNHVVSMVITYLIYGVILGCIVFVAKRMAPHLPLWVTLAFIVFLLTPINWENNFWGFESSFRFAVLFTLLAAYLLFSEPQTGRRLALGALMSVLATYSFFAGLVAVCILMVAFALYKVVRAVRLTGPDRKAEYVQLIAVATPVLILVGLYFINYHRHAYLPPVAYPYEASFWSFFANIVSWGFGFESHSVMLGALCLLLVLAPIVLEIRKKGLHVSGSSWAGYAFTLGMLAVLGSVSAGRANLSASAKISRYADFATMLVPFTALAWAIFLKDRPAVKKYMLVGLWIFCCLGFSYKWLWFRVYTVERDSRRQGVECIKTYYKQGGPANCPTLYSVPIGPMLDDAKRLNFSFYRDIRDEL